MLDDMGHDVRLAISAADALSQIDSDPSIDLIVTDQLMPGMTGLELVERVRRNRPDMPILLVSGFAELAPSAELSVPLLAKPFSQVQLADGLRRALLKANVVPIRSRRA